MALRLRPRDPSKHLVGNAILYGGERRMYNHPKDAPHEAEIFFVETDFGNHMALTWGEVTEMFTVAGWQDYDQWRAARAVAQNQPRLRTQSEEEALREAMFSGTEI